MNIPSSSRTPFSQSRLGRWLKRRWIIIVAVVAVLGIGAGVYAFIMPRNTAIKPPTTSKKKEQEKQRYFSHLTGVEVADEAALTAPVTAVMIENSPDARPQSGLKKAGVVYEAVAEGGITRFIALYQGEKPELIGPVRSLRIHFLEWAVPYQASIAHVGGSYNALEAVRSGYRDIDQFFNANTYWRSSDRYAPHNVYTSGTNLNELNTAKGFNQSAFESFKRVDGKPAAEVTAATISVDFSSPQYSTSYAYNAETNSYVRSLAGQVHADREEGQIEPAVIVVLKVNAQSRGGSDGYEDLVTSGEGQAYVFQNGTATEVIWRKDGREAPLRLTDSEGQPVALGRGQTWISAITSRGNVAWQ